MIRSFFPVIFAILANLLFGSLQILFLRFFNKVWWQQRIIRRLSWSLPLVGMGALLLWGVGEYRRIDWIGFPGMAIASLVFVLELALLFSFPVSGIFHLINRGLDALVRHRHTDTAVDSNRRMVLKGIAAAAPILALSTGTAGLTRAFGPVNVFLKPLEFDNLPPDLENYRILHLSDLHLRHYTTLDTLAEVMEEAQQFKPNLILVTGDVADDLHQLPGALHMVEEFGAPDGYFASLGNHEYFRGVKNVQAIFDRTTVPLFINQGQRLTIGSTPVYIAGIDDPRYLGSKDTPFFRQTIDTVLENVRSDDFVVLMSHRPDALDYASQHGINLILAGHTHGGQIGINGRSVFESYWHDRYLWGEYRKGGSVLYTSSGVGHWFPFRLGCPPEAPIIELKRRAS